MKEEVFREIAGQLREGSAAQLVFEAEGERFVRRWVPKERLLLLGGGHIALPLCRIGAMLEFEVTVVDDRPDFANRLRFPEAAEVCCGRFEEEIRRFGLRETDYVCVITRGHRWDAECLRTILGEEKAPFYLGMIGSKRRVAGLRELLTEKGVNRERLDALCAPIGLPIKAETTQEIAVSIAAQLVEYRRRDSCRTAEGERLVRTNADLEVLEALGGGAGKRTLALVIRTRGSTPVKSGALMAVDRLGKTTGTIGGGCSEAEVIQLARRMAGTGEKQVVRVDMTNDAAAEEGMVCGGTMEVLLESVDG